MDVNGENKKLYTTLGQLFYAIAATDKEVRQEEISKLKELVRTNWIPFDSQADQIEPAFEELLLSGRLNPQECVANFKIFKENNPVLFTDELKELIWETVRSIAFVVGHNNKSELVMMSQISIILKS